MATLGTRTKNGIAYWVLNHSEGGRQKRPSLGRCDQLSQRDAQLRVDAKNLELKTGKRIFVHAPLFETFRTEYLEWHSKEYPDSHQRIAEILTSEHVDKAFKGVALSDSDMVKKIETWRAGRKGHVKHNTIVKEFRALSAFFNSALSRGRGIDANPCKKCKQISERRGKPPVWFTRDEAAMLYEQLHGYTWQLACNTGMRRGELLACEPSWFNLHRKELTIVSQEGDKDEDGNRTKSGHFRIVPLNPAAIAALHALMEDRQGQQYVLRRITPTSLSRAFKIDLARAGIVFDKPYGSLHSTRHTYAAHMIMGDKAKRVKGVSLRKLKDLLGHAHMSTTMIYAHLAEDHETRQALKIAV
jgi:integrase